jgi:cytochrome c oxidase assembly protein subunit 15
MQRFALINIAWTFIVITLGALTRLLDAGLGCPDWPVCYGQIIPQANDVAAQFSHWSFDSGKAWMEMIHRYAASALGLAIIIQAVIIWPRYTGAVRWLSVFLIFWVMLQGMFGMWTVTLRLWPPVVSAHLLGGAITLGAQFLIWKTLSSNREPKFNNLWSVFALVVFIQMALGAWTSSQYAGLACPDFPTCQGRMWVDMDSSIFDAPMVQGDEYLGGMLGMQQRMGIQWLHRLGALAVVLLFLFLVMKKHRQRKSLYLVAVFLALQILLGILNAVLLLPLTLALLHNSVGMLLWMSALNGLSEKDNVQEQDKKETISKELLV